MWNWTWWKGNFCAAHSKFINFWFLKICYKLKMQLENLQQMHFVRNFTGSIQNGSNLIKFCERYSTENASFLAKSNINFPTTYLKLNSWFIKFFCWNKIDLIFQFICVYRLEASLKKVTKQFLFSDKVSMNFFVQSEVLSSLNNGFKWDANRFDLMTLRPLFSHQIWKIIYLASTSVVSQRSN